MRPSISVRIDNEVHEHRAPTDESIRLYREMVEKARTELTHGVRVDNTIMDAVLHIFKDPVHMQEHYIVDIKLNGHPIKVQFDRPYQHSQNPTRDERIQDLFDTISQQLARALFNKWATNGGLINLLRHGGEL